MNMLQTLWHYAPLLLSGAGVTLWTWLLGSVLGLAIGASVALLRRLPVRPLQWVLRIYIEIIRGTPFLLQLFLLYSGGPSIGIRLSALTAGVVCLGVHAGAYFAEVFRAGFEGLPKGQIEAASSFGMTSFQILYRISLPTMLVAIFPSIVSILISLSKETVILSIITVPNLMYQVQSMTVETYSAFSGIAALAVFYWVFVECVARFSALIEYRLTLFARRDSAEVRA
ncbi:amino acid ABC transporter permease [Acidisoma silvae]|uniref:Amino acid ABC transporter permease n=1 Tax=Acidisoma silvae TaxID=2802396 RepID=A0A963YXI1_9PROT|nr:amino acid ABC transporter permease [Acidisoma silvae]MCB8878142.1 amino acid ABC transporter permease [Acidisoma silvae]